MRILVFPGEKPVDGAHAGGSSREPESLQRFIEGRTGAANASIRECCLTMRVAIFYIQRNRRAAMNVGFIYSFIPFFNKE